MPIRTKPWSEVSLADVEDLITREIREDSTIEFKRELALATGDQQREFLKDVTAMANAVGGTIIFGAAEGRGDGRGQIVQIQGQALDRDDVEQKIMNLLRDKLDERLDGVLFKALPSGIPGEYVCVLRIPASPLAPHRIKSGGDQFYMRGSVSNSPMDTRQIREKFLQRETAAERALALIDIRTQALKDAATRRRDELHFGPAPLTNPDQVVLHVIPLFPHAGGWRLGPERERRLMLVPPLGAPQPFDHPYYAAVGMYSRFPDRRHVLFLRQGGMEFQRYDVLTGRGEEGRAPRFEAWRVELDVLEALEAAEALTDEGLLPRPVMVSLRIFNVRNTSLQRYPNDAFGTDELQDDTDDVLLTPFIVHAWGDGARAQFRDACDEMWQAWHLPQSFAFHENGEHHRYDSEGRTIQHPRGV
jgi:hypothetical protein